MSFTPKFDPASIVFSFAAISDLHIKNEEGQYNKQKVISGLEQLKALAAETDPRGLAAVVVAGDLTQDGKPEEVEALRATLEQSIDLSRMPFIYCTGNHDKHDPDCNLTYARAFADNEALFDKCELSPEGAWGGCRHYALGDYHFITLSPEKYHKKHPNTFHPDTRLWLDRTLAEITSAHPESYVFVINHLLIWDTCYGSLRSTFHATEDINPILEKYPQVLTFGGHLHYPLNDERSIMQTAFTSVETATFSNMLIDGHDLQNVIKNTKTLGNTHFSQGLLVQIDAAGAIRITRMDFFHRALIERPWYLDPPAADGSHLTRYTKARATESEPAVIAPPQLLRAEPLGDSEDGVRLLEVSFAGPLCVRPVRCHRITLTDTDGAEVYSGKYLNDFYHYPSCRVCSHAHVYTLPCPDTGRFTLTVTPLDCWENEGAAASVEIKL